MEKDHSAHLEEESRDRLSGADGSIADKDGTVTAEAEQRGLSHVSFLRSLYTDIVRKLNAPNFNDIKHLKAEITPFDHQKRAAGVIAQAKDSRFRGVIIADPPASGKALSSLLLPISEMTEGSYPVVVVAPESHTQQWADEIHNIFEATVSVLLLDNTEASVGDLFKYTVVVTSYGHLSYEYDRTRKFSEWLRGCPQAEGQGLHANPPRRGSGALLSYDWERDIEKPWAKYLILDEAHIIKNIESDVYAAVKQLRSRMDLCVMLTATPLEDSWINAYAYLDLLGGHPFKSRTDLSCALNLDHPFGNPYQTVPTGEHKSRLAQLLDAVTLRRPMTAMRHVLPPLEIREKTFKVPEDVLSRSNEMFQRLIATGSEQPHGLFNHAHDPDPQPLDTLSV